MTLLYIFIGFLIIIIFFQAYVKKKKGSEIKYLSKKLESIISKNTSEKLMIFTDDTSIKELLDQINHLLDHNQTILARFKKEEESIRKLLTNISHDMKTPLTVVLGNIETVKHDKALSEEERSVLLTRAYDKALEVLNLMNKFFDLAKLESGDKDIEITRLNMNEVLRKNILAFYDILSSKDIEVHIDIPEETLYAFANEEALTRVINNLIDNAINYGSDGRALGVTLYSDEKFIYVDIWDKGKGISEIHQDMIFERMYTLEDSRNKKYQGSGLGLTITKRLIEKMGGEIKLVSKPYEKTVFTVKLKKITY